ncbi:uncharacterized protein ACN427_000869 isoform 2-T2 [Glossina fuscipes fuscipes]
MEESEEGTFRKKFLLFLKSHLLAAAFGLITLLQWLYILNWEPWEFATNPIVNVCSIPPFVEWIFILLLVECLTLSPLAVVIRSSGLGFAICLSAAVATLATFSFVGLGLSKHFGTKFTIVIDIGRVMAMGLFIITIVVALLLRTLTAIYICVTVAYFTIVMFIMYNGTLLETERIISFTSVASLALIIYCETYILSIISLYVCWITDRYN